MSFALLGKPKTTQIQLLNDIQFLLVPPLSAPTMNRYHLSLSTLLIHVGEELII